MILKGKKIAFLGDSITQGVRTSCEEEKRFSTLIAARTGAECLNYGISGTRFARQLRPTVDAPSFDLDFCGRALEIDRDSDIIVVFGGTNDYGHGDAPFGEYGDTTCSTFCGAAYELCGKLAQNYPAADIVFITPLHRLGEDVPNASNSRVLKDYVDIIRRTCEYFSIPVLDLYASGRFQPAVKAICDRYMPDGLHPNDEGHELLAARIIGYLSAL